MQSKNSIINQKTKNLHWKNPKKKSILTSFKHNPIYTSITSNKLHQTLINKHNSNQTKNTQNSSSKITQIITNPYQRSAHPKTKKKQNTFIQLYGNTNSTISQFHHHHSHSNHHINSFNFTITSTHSKKNQHKQSTISNPENKIKQSQWQSKLIPITQTIQSLSSQ